jgi:hypothetical protein
MLSTRDHLAHILFCILLASAIGISDSIALAASNERAMAMDIPPQYPPIRDMILPKKNYEAWFMPADQDDEGLVRPTVSIKWCPFGGDGCQHHNFRNACVWSLHSTDEVLSYLMQHGTHSSHHQLTEGECYDKICDQWSNIEWSNTDDKFEDREIYRETVRKHKEQEAQAKGTSKAAPQASARKGNDKGKGKRKAPDQRVKEEDDGDAVAASAMHNAGAMQTLCDTVLRAVDGRLAQQLFDAQRDVASSSDDRWNGIHDGPPSRGPSLSLDCMGAPERQLQTAFPDGTISIPVGKLILVQDSLQRAEHAIVGGMTGLVETAKKMNVERNILGRTIDVLADITGQKPTHAM